MNAAPAFAVRGWCPGALRPMESGDGLLVRIRPFAASLSRRQMRAIAEAAEAYGNGHIDLTRRANLQLRGVRRETLGAVQKALGALDLLDDTAQAESVRNILVSPLAGIDAAEVLDMRPLAHDLAARLAALPGALGLPAKFSFVLDGGGRLPLTAERADIRVVAISVDKHPMTAIGRGEAGGGETEWLGMTEPENAVTNIAAIITGERHNLQSVETQYVQKAHNPRTSAGPELGFVDGVLALGLPFGWMEARQLHSVADIAIEIRLSPWRAIYAVPAGEAGPDSLATTGEAGFVTRTSDPLMRIQACPGSPACEAAHADTRADAGRIATWMTARHFAGTAHVSGCAKGCASSAAATITLVGGPGGYRLLRNAAARDPGGRIVPPSAIPAALDGLGGDDG